jgi:hypothetical protein
LSISRFPKGRTENLDIMIRILGKKLEENYFPEEFIGF